MFLLNQDDQMLKIEINDPIKSWYVQCTNCSLFQRMDDKTIFDIVHDTYTVNLISF